MINLKKDQKGIDRVLHTTSIIIMPLRKIINWERDEKKELHLQHLL